MKKISPSRQMQKIGEEAARAFEQGLASPQELRLDSALEERTRILEERLAHKGDMRIYDFADSSDEIVQVIYADGTTDDFDAGHLLMNGRGLDDLDYEYELKGDRIREWMEFAPEKDGDTISYQRARHFGGTFPWMN